MTEEDKLNAIKKKLNVIIVEMLEVEENQITPDANFRTDLNADSLDLLNITLKNFVTINNPFPNRIIKCLKRYIR